MTESYFDAIKNVRESIASFCKFISANDLGVTGGHQAGFYVSKYAAKILFNCDCVKGTIEDRWIQIGWQNGVVTTSRYVYYGKGTRDEGRITNFGRNFEFMQDDYVGSYLIISKKTDNSFVASVLTSEEDIDEFILQYNIPVNAKSYVIEGNEECHIDPVAKLKTLLFGVVSRFDSFPETSAMSQFAQDCYNTAYKLSDKSISSEPDKTLIKWIDTESTLFYLLEDKIYKPIYSSPFDSISDFTTAANEILNRRKSRAGKSLEHHLSKIFTSSKLKFEEQAVTEDNKKPDFLFPGGEEYHSLIFPADDLIMLGAKTTCKDRWRQVVTEADRIDTKFLFTLQPGISKNQLKEMTHENLQLVVPKDNKNCFPKEYQESLFSLQDFICFVHSKQDKYKYFG